MIVDCLGYESWEDSYLVKFNEFLGVSTVGYENEILGLLRNMVSQQPRDKRKGNLLETKCERVLRKLECSIYYNGQSHNRGGGMDRGNFFAKAKMKLKLISWNVRGANNPDKRKSH